MLFWHAFESDLRDAHPVPKLLVIKAVVFFSFWQSVLIAILVDYDVITDDPTRKTYAEKGERATALQDFLVCIEMFIAALAHHKVGTASLRQPRSLREASDCLRAWASASPGSRIAGEGGWGGARSSC